MKENKKYKEKHRNKSVKMIENKWNTEYKKKEKEKEN